MLKRSHEWSSSPKGERIQLMLQTLCYGGGFIVVPAACPHVCQFLSSFSTLLEKQCVAGEGCLRDANGTGCKCSMEGGGVTGGGNEELVSL